jgi:aspartate kinase
MSSSETIVMKFGGTSVRNDSARTSAMRHVKNYFEEGKDIVVVVSAMGRKGEPYSTDTLINLLKLVGSHICPKELDSVMSVGENLSAAYFAHFLTQNGMTAISFDGRQAGILTDDNAGNAEILEINPSRIRTALADGKIAVVAGFQGANSDGDVRTLGRGGSDTSAVALGAALGAERVEIYSDVDGIANCDPRQVTHAPFMRAISAAQMITMSDEGSKVIHPRAIKASLVSKIPIVARNTFSEMAGTTIFHDKSANNKCVTLAHRNDMVLVEFEYAHDAGSHVSGVINIDSKRVILKDDVYFSAKLSKLEQNFGFYKVTKGWATVSVVFSDKAPKAMEIDAAEILDTQESVISYLLLESEMRAALNTLHATYT